MQDLFADENIRRLVASISVVHRVVGDTSYRKWDFLAGRICDNNGVVNENFERIRWIGFNQGFIHAWGEIAAIRQQQAMDNWLLFGNHTQADGQAFITGADLGDVAVLTACAGGYARQGFDAVDIREYLSKTDL